MAAKRLSMDRIRGVVNMGREAEENMEEHLHLSVLVDEAAPEWMVRTIRDALMPTRDALVDVRLLSGAPAVAGIDVGIVLSGGSDEYVRTAIRCFAGARQHVVVLAQSSLDIPETHLPSKLGQYVSEVVASEPEQLADKFAAALLDSTEKDVSCAANFEFCRQVATARLVSRCAARNAFMGVANFIPGAGMPLMTMNQVNLSFDIAATYGHGLSLGRAPEVISVILAGFAYRWIAHVAMRVAPGLGLLLRTGIAYGGTLVTGRMMSSHFTETLPSAEPPVSVVSRVEEIIESCKSNAGDGETQAEEVPAKMYVTIGGDGNLA